MITAKFNSSEFIEIILDKKYNLYNKDNKIILRNISVIRSYDPELDKLPSFIKYNTKKNNKGQFGERLTIITNMKINEFDSLMYLKNKKDKYMLYDLIYNNTHY